MGPFKNLFNAKSLTETAKAIQSIDSNFPAELFLKKTIPQLEGKEMKARVKMISAALHEFCPDLEKASEVFKSVIQSEKNMSGLSGFQVWPLTQYIEDYGRDHWKVSLNTLRELTKVMSAEFAVRPFLISEPEKTLTLFLKWAKDKNVHIRRLSSEGSRPLLPWGQRIKKFQDDPNFTLPILRILKNDPELYVRKSVANHLNDLAKNHPKTIIKELKNWIKNDPQNKHIQWIAKHSLRTLIKNGDKEALSLFGFKKANATKFTLELKPNIIAVGDSLNMFFSATANKKEKWLIDYIVHHQKSNGRSKPKVFKWTERNIDKGRVLLHKKHPMKKVTTRKYYSGEHHIEIQLNGTPVIKKKFFLSTSR